MTTPATIVTAPLNRRLSVAPMLDWTDRHYRYFVRLLTRHTLLYSEMVTTGALLHGDCQRFLQFDPSEHPLALQLAGSHPNELARCAKIGAAWNYDELNLNVGCPSERVQNGRFGACLMAEPQLVAACIAAMKDAVTLPVTVKTRIGIDDRDSYAELVDFIGALIDAGTDAFIIHARKAWLKGLSPKDNRAVPPLRYDVVAQLKSDFPTQTFVLNGGIETFTAAAELLTQYDGVMIGRAAYHNPWLLADADRVIFNAAAPALTREAVVANFLPYAEQQLAAGVPLNALTRHLLGLFQGQPGARAWRRQISTRAHRPDATLAVLTPPAAPELTR
ncbi:tRNA dihydrouridine(20/20a) synthase DusA [Chromatium okenii]|uniref:tRNA dihydrouridine(20/20a) synthase DusA n=1 Tax=Chromatium okenii TaxID=61644 RepID=UPI001904C8E8|nr:tRNA dihydrouridine(20/20a) synthase DusA [Chromatium okenii]MBK1641559.1 tRNA dihydrouridine(20/20a) synthase DusA [Chromatium okenii]